MIKCQHGKELVWHKLGFQYLHLVQNGATKVHPHTKTNRVHTPQDHLLRGYMTVLAMK